MKKLDSTVLIVTIIVIFYITNKISMYIRYKKSGKIMLRVKLKKDFLVNVIWGATALVLFVPTVGQFFKGNSISFENLRNPILWACFIIIIAFIENQAPKITEGGILSSGKFWGWKDINSCKWEGREEKILSIDAKSALILIKYPTIVRWRVIPEQKLSINNLLKNKMQ